MTKTPQQHVDAAITQLASACRALGKAKAALDQIRDTDRAKQAQDLYRQCAILRGLLEAGEVPHE